MPCHALPCLQNSFVLPTDIRYHSGYALCSNMMFINRARCCKLMILSQVKSFIECSLRSSPITSQVFSIDWKALIFSSRPGLLFTCFKASPVLLLPGKSK